MIFSDQEDNYPQWIGILNPSDGSLVSNYKLQDTSNNYREARVSEDSIILTSTYLLIGMADHDSKFRMCRYTHNPSISFNWCKYTSSSNASRVYAITLDLTQTYVFAGGYYGAGSNDKIALVMKIRLSDGTDEDSYGWFQSDVADDYYRV